MLLYGIASSISYDVDDFSLTRRRAERRLAEILDDEPELADLLSVVAIELNESRN